MKNWCWLLAAATWLGASVAAAEPSEEPSRDREDSDGGVPASSAAPGPEDGGRGVLATSAARDDESTGVAAPANAAARTAFSPKRAIPDYSGRGPERRPVGGEIALWIPRTILSPLYFVNEFVLRRPLALVVPPLEKEQVPRKVYDFFVFGADHKAGIVPIGFAEFNFNPSVGVYAFWYDALFAGSDLVLHAEAWPADWLEASVSERIRLSSRSALRLKLVGLERPDHMFFGLGPSAPETHRSRYGATSVDGSAALGAVLWRSSRIDATVGIRDVRTYNGHFGGDPNLQEESSRGAFTLPYGFGEQYSLTYCRLQAVLDTRLPYPHPGSGVRIEGQVEQDSAWSPPQSTGWIHYGATAGGFWDINGYRRVLSLSVAVLFADPVASQPIPFTELVSLGGDGPMRGFYPGRLLDRSAAAATLRYVWPVGPWLDASLALATGNVFGVHLDEFRAGLLRLSAAAGLVVTASADAPLELLLGAGTETFDDKARLNTVRVTFGVNRF